MKTFMRLTTIGAALALCAVPLWAEDFESPPRQPQDVATIDGLNRVIESGSFRLETALVGEPQEVRLLVTSAPEPGELPAPAGKPSTRVYSGETLDAIAMANADLKEEPGWDDFERLVANAPKPEPKACTWAARIVDGDLTYETWHGAKQDYLIHDDGASRWLYRGTDLGAILAAQPDLGRTPSAAKLRSQDGLLRALALRDGPAADPAQDHAQMHMRLLMKPDGTSITIWKRNADGQLSAAEYQGSDPESIRAKEPAVADAFRFWSAEANEAPASMPLDIRELGITLREERSVAEGPAVTQVVVVRVASDGRGARLGLQSGDVLREVNDEEVDSVQTAEALLARKERMKDRACRLLVLRGGQPVSLPAIPEEASGMHR